MNKLEKVEHTLQPIFDENSKVLFLGTMPSPKSREKGMYYGHPQNRFWRVMAKIFNAELPQGAEECKKFALEHNFALWDVLKSCEIRGAEDASIKNPEPNDISLILNAADIRLICATGQKSAQLYRRFIFPKTGIEIKSLPSTSAANCRNYNFDSLVGEYKIILDYLP